MRITLTAGECKALGVPHKDATFDVPMFPQTAQCKDRATGETIARSNPGIVGKGTAQGAGIVYKLQNGSLLRSYVVVKPVSTATARDDRECIS